MALVIGLTGGIGSGKSTVGDYFSQLGASVIDADDIARELCCPKHEVFKKILKRFGSSILDINEEFDRKKLRKIIFENSVEQKWLESILHPLIIEAILSWIKQLNTNYCIVVAPLLLETTMKDYVDRVLVVDAEEKEQIQRVILRDKTNKGDIGLILSKQLPRKERIKLANDVILNNAGLEELREKVVELDSFYRKLARAV